jgi:hypothetical protein
MTIGLVVISCYPFMRRRGAKHVRGVLLFFGIVAGHKGVGRGAADAVAGYALSLGLSNASVF